MAVLHAHLSTLYTFTVTAFNGHNTHGPIMMATEKYFLTNIKP